MSFLFDFNAEIIIPSSKKCYTFDIFIPFIIVKLLINISSSLVKASSYYKSSRLLLLKSLIINSLFIILLLILIKNLKAIIYI